MMPQQTYNDSTNLLVIAKLRTLLKHYDDAQLRLIPINNILNRSDRDVVRLVDYKGNHGPVIDDDALRVLQSHYKQVSKDASDEIARMTKNYEEL